MPKVKPLTRKHPIELYVSGIVGKIMMAGKMSVKDLSKKTGIPETTLGSRIYRSGDFLNLRLGEFIEIVKVGEAEGLLNEGDLK